MRRRRIRRSVRRFLVGVGTRHVSCDCITIMQIRQHKLRLRRDNTERSSERRHTAPDGTREQAKGDHVNALSEVSGLP